MLPTKPLAGNLSSGTVNGTRARRESFVSKVLNQNCLHGMHSHVVWPIALRGNRSRTHAPCDGPCWPKSVLRSCSALSDPEDTCHQQSQCCLVFDTASHPMHQKPCVRYVGACWSHLACPLVEGGLGRLAAPAFRAVTACDRVSVLSHASFVDVCKPAHLCASLHDRADIFNSVAFKMSTEWS